MRSAYQGVREVVFSKILRTYQINDPYLLNIIVLLTILFTSRNASFLFYPSLCNYFPRLYLVTCLFNMGAVNTILLSFYNSQIFI